MSEPIGNLVAMLWEKDHLAADQAMQRLQAESADSGAVVAFLDVFFAKLAHQSAYQRMRAMMLIACNAKWDAAGYIDEKLPQYLAHILDPKPIAARWCIQQLPKLAAAKPQLRERICTALQAADFSRYADSMRPLLQRDREAALAAITA